jgi:hypothetical protein
MVPAYAHHGLGQVGPACMSKRYSFIDQRCPRSTDLGARRQCRHWRRATQGRFAAPLLESGRVAVADGVAGAGAGAGAAAGTLVTGGETAEPEPPGGLLMPTLA